MNVEERKNQNAHLRYLDSLRNLKVTLESAKNQARQFGYHCEAQEILEILESITLICDIQKKRMGYLMIVRSERRKGWQGNKNI
jgi:hypothetical protein